MGSYEFPLQENLVVLLMLSSADLYQDQRNILMTSLMTHGGRLLQQCTLNEL